MHLKKQIDQLQDPAGAYWPERLYSQLEFLYELCKADKTQETSLLSRVTTALLQTKAENGGLTKSDVLKAEQELLAYRPAAKSYRLHMVSHAHIDMDWRWGFEETVGVVIDTFHTMLRLLAEYPDFIYTQSQASVYEIVEKYAPELLDDIKKYVKEGRWEVIASTWVEADKNLPNGESMARHILYAKRYLSGLLDLDPVQMEVDFEPDTFGHSSNVPEFLSQGGVRYYYHCRGNDEEELYRWQAPSGAEILTLRDPQWYYLKETDYHIAWHVPGFCARNHVKSALRFYGVGDHGGGPSRRDIERILDMQTWPLMPVIIFSRLHDFFHEVEKARELLSVVRRELNFVFTGCYTAQSRLKLANRQGEDRLYDTETLCALAVMAGCGQGKQISTEMAWRNILFNQFHDIVTGSCTRETKESALGRFREALAVGIANSKWAMRRMGERISTDSFPCGTDPNAVAESGGHGYGSWGGNGLNSVYSVNGAANTGGKVRVYTLFNTTAYEREELVELTVWDWSEPLEGTVLCGIDGVSLPFDIMEENRIYWHHKYSTVHFVAKIPAFGYCNYYVIPADCPADRIGYFEGPRMHRQTDEPIVLENEKLRAVFCRETMELVSLLDKVSGQEQLEESSGYFNLVDEQSVMPYSAWTVGQVGKTENLNRTCFVHILEESHRKLQDSVTYEMAFRSSAMKVKVSLTSGAAMLRFSVEADWHEVGREGQNTPQLQFCVPYGYRARAIRYDVPGGCLDRLELGHDVPAIRYAAPVPEESARSGIFLTSDCKYGYRGFEGRLCIDLLRSYVNPDPYPEYGVCRAQIGLGITPDADWRNLAEQADIFAHPIYVYSNTVHAGELPERGQLLEVRGRASVSAVKPAEDGNGVVVRMYQSDETETEVYVTCPDLKQVVETDLLEQDGRPLAVEKEGAFVKLPAGGVRTIRLRRSQ